MTDSMPPENEIIAEFRKLGQSLVDVLRASWERPERKKLQDDIENGLKELGQTLKEEADKFTASPTGQTIKSDLQDISDRLRSGEIEAKARQEILNGLRTINVELHSIQEKWAAKNPPEPPTPTNPAE